MSIWRSIRCDEIGCETMHHIEDDATTLPTRSEGNALGWAYLDGIGDVCPDCVERRRSDERERDEGEDS